MSGASDAWTTSISQWPGRDGSAIVISPILTSAAAAPEEKRQEVSSAVTRRVMTVRWVGNVVRGVASNTRVRARGAGHLVASRVTRWPRLFAQRNVLPPQLFP
jgi:hypothetical protein